MQTIPPIDTPAFQADLHANYRRLRETDPVHRYVFGGETRVSLLRYDDSVAAFRDPRFGPVRVPEGIFEGLLNSGRTDLANLARVLSGILLLKEGEDHARVRRLVSSAFTPRMIERSAPAIEALVNELLSGLAGRARVDLIADFAVPLPVAVIAGVLGVPAEACERLKRWSFDFAPILDRRLNAEGLLPAAAACTAFAEFLAPLFEVRRREPQDDLLTALVAAAEDDDRLSADELLAACLLLLVAGHETTTNLIANGVFTLLQHPDALAWLRRRTGAMDAAVEELLRFEGPIRRTPRHTHVDLEVRGVSIPAGTIVDMVMASANRDPERFADPDGLDLERTDNRHLAFGLGEHFCLGATLSRLETRAALRGLLERFPAMKRRHRRPPLARRQHVPSPARTPRIAVRASGRPVRSSSRSGLAATRSVGAIAAALALSVLALAVVAAAGGPAQMVARAGAVGPLVSFVAHTLVAITPASDFVPWGLANGAVFGALLGGALNWLSWLNGAGIQWSLARRAALELNVEAGLARLPRWLRELPVEHPAVLTMARWFPLGGFSVTVLAGLRGVPLRRVLAFAALGLVPPAFVVSALGAGLFALVDR